MLIESSETDDLFQYDVFIEFASNLNILEIFNLTYFNLHIISVECSD